VELLQFKYRAFLSYSHRDKAWGKWLHSALERYRIDPDLVGRNTSAGAVPKTLRPIFRDRDDFSAGHSLTDETSRALAASQFLIVVCSPNAARSKYVSEEVRRFKALGRCNEILPVIVDGEPGDPERECFPLALRCKLGPDGNPTAEPEELIAADARPQGDDKALALSKVVAGLLGVNLDEIVRRADQARRRHMRLLGALVILFLALAVAASSSAWIAYRELQVSNARLESAIDAYALVSQAMAKLSRKISPSQLLANAEDALKNLFNESANTARQQLRKATLLISFVDAYQTIGATEEARKRGDQARTILADLLKRTPDDPALQLDLASAYEHIADVLKLQGDLPGTLDSLRSALAVRESVHQASANPAALIDLALSFNALGESLQTKGDLDSALEAFQQGLAIAKRAISDDRFDSEQQYALSRILTSIGNLYSVRNGGAESLDYYEQALAIRKRLAENDPANPQWQRLLAFSYSWVGDSLQTQGELAQALVMYRESLRLRQQLVDRYPENMTWLEDLAWMHTYIGDVLLLQQNGLDALDHYRLARTDFERLAATDKFNRRWQRDLAWSIKGTGQVLAALEEYAAAINAFRAAVSIYEPLVKSAPDNEVWRRDLANTYLRMGNVFKLQGDNAGASQSYSEALKICPRDDTSLEWLLSLNTPVKSIADARACPPVAPGAPHL
jgi:tetratricopeptide (TPR) repeat protein